MAGDLSCYDAKIGLKSVAGLLVAVSINCGGSSSNLDCDWLASDNCWKTTASAAQSCLPLPSSSGTFSADMSTCTYAAGQVVTFTPPLTLPVPNNNSTWNFTVANGASPCLTYQEGVSKNVTLTVMGQTFTEDAAGISGLHVTCPDGTSFSNANAFSLLSCPGGSFGGLPGIAWSGGSTSLSVGLINTGGDADGGFGLSLSVFDCRAP